MCVANQIFEVDPLACPTCHGPMRIVAFITQPSVIAHILVHLRPRAAAGARSPPSTRAPRHRDRRDEMPDRHGRDPPRPLSTAPGSRRWDGAMRCAREPESTAHRFGPAA